MNSVIVKLFALYGTLKNLHYSPVGQSFYSVHKLADDMADGLMSFADEIQENYYLGNGLPHLNLKDVYSSASAEVVSGDTITCFKGALALINELILLCGEENTASVEDIFSRLNNHLFKIKGFVLKSIL